MKTAGISACKLGWLLITFDDKQESYNILPDEAALKTAVQKYDRIFIDLPIGLEEENYDRECDILMRREVGEEYAEEVLSPPIRPALYAPSYVEANMINYDYTEKEIRLEVWSKVPKIQTVDRLLRENPALRTIILECHPEFLFQILNKGIIFQKTNLKRGIRHRLELVRTAEPVADDFFRDIKEEYRRSDVSEKVIVDTMAMALFAKKSVAGVLKTIPKNPTPDSEGLPRAYHFA